MEKPKNSIRPAWIEVDLAKVRKNFELIINEKPQNVGFIAVLKNQADGHGAEEIGKIALEFGSIYLAVATIDEATELKLSLPQAPIMIFGERTEEELELCLLNNFTCFINSVEGAKKFSEIAKRKGKCPKVHVEIDTGLSRYGIRWTEAIEVIEYINNSESLELEGVMSHFAMSDELDKTFALTQLDRFQEVVNAMGTRGIKIKHRHICNSGGFLDLPQAHFDLVRLGILPLGVYPSEVCRRISGIEPALSVKCKISATRDIEAGEFVGYGMRYKAESPRRIATLPIGYGDGYPRVRNTGEVLIHGKRAPIVGGNAADATMIDITEIPETKLWDEVVLIGESGKEKIGVREVAKYRNTAYADILACLNARLPRRYIGKQE